MKRLKLLCFLVPVLATTLNAQIINVKGNVSTSTEVVNNALITFTDENDTTNSYSALTDSLGNYTIGLITGIDDNTSLVPTKFELAQNYPNPFTSETAITYKLNKQSDVLVTIYDILGREVKNYEIGWQSAGVHGILWDGRNDLGERVSTGIYFYKLQMGKESLVNKMVFMKGAGISGNLNLNGNFIPSAKPGKAAIANNSIGSYRGKIENTENTEPRIAAKELGAILIGKDTTINFSVNKLPIANAGEDCKVKVGQYAILDGTQSKGGDGSKLTYHWSADSANPAIVMYLYFQPQIITGFAKEGTYKFYLVVNDSIADSEPDEVVVEVGPRGESKFEDPVMELQVRYALNDPTGELTDEKLASLNNFIFAVMFGKITSLEGIENCSNLAQMNLGLNSISDLTPLSSLTKLEDLALDQNYIISDITPLAKLTNLTVLNLESNNISDISELKNLTKMYSLYLLDNPIEDFSPLKDFKELNDLWIGRFGDNTYPCTGTDVISNFTKLDILWITDCDVQDVSFVATLSVLEYLRLSHCNVYNISAISNCTHLVRLYLDNNNITDIAPLEGLTNLNLLDLKYNKITNIEPLVKNSRLGQGDAISLNGNPLDQISINQYILELRNRGVTVFY
jgi:flagellar hook assembly protein FlgD